MTTEEQIRNAIKFHARREKEGNHNTFVLLGRDYKDLYSHTKNKIDLEKAENYFTKAIESSQSDDNVRKIYYAERAEVSATLGKNDDAIADVIESHKIPGDAMSDSFVDFTC